MDQARFIYVIALMCQRENPDSEIKRVREIAPGVIIVYSKVIDVYINPSLVKLKEGPNATHPPMTTFEDDGDTMLNWHITIPTVGKIETHVDMMLSTVGGENISFHEESVHHILDLSLFER